MNTRRRPLLAALALLGTGLPWVAAAQSPRYRDNQPEVLERAAPGVAEQAQDEAVLARFTQAYQAAGRPRVLVLWHRSVSERFTDEQTVTAGAVSIGPQAEDQRAQFMTVSFKDQPAQAVSPLAPARAAEYESSLTQTLLGAGVRLVDRNMALRMTALKAVKAASAPAGSLDAPTVEAQAFVDLADQVLQVQLLPDASAPRGWRARLTVVDVRSGGLLADSLRLAPAAASAGVVARTQATPGQDSTRIWQATEKGFVAQQRTLPISQLARRDAIALMDRLARS